MRDQYEGEPGYSIRDNEVEFVSEYAKECRKIGAKYLDKLTVERAKQKSTGEESV